ncbi:MAG: GNAT family N-acetyltransferase [Candidatus Lokiarchaeota archaeon]|nr:GNAT family N-acetyltransferase [Candidatus Lokiarchaeota archaeon]
MNLDIKPLTSDLIKYFLNFFDNIAFSDNPEWGGCYCHFYHFPGNKEEWGKATKDQNRNATKTLIKKEIMKGLLAFVNNEPVGWCNVNSKDVYEKNPFDNESEEVLEGKVASIMCFLIAPAYRKKGVARKLLIHAIEMLKEKGYAWIEAYPRKGDLSDAHSYHGPVSLFNSEDFTIIREDEHFLLMRKSLA